MSGVRRSPNIWDSPQVYEVENLAVDRAGVIESAMARVHPFAGTRLHPFAGTRLLDIGCGTGFHLPRFAELGASVVGVEPHPPLAALARKRLRDNDIRSATVLVASVEDLPLADRSLDVAHARWAYFFGAGSEPGLAELDRVMRPGGTAYVIDNDATRSTFGAWFRDAYPTYDARAVERFWQRRGWNREPLTIRWDFERRADLEAVVAIELPEAAAEQILAGHAGNGVDYAVNLWWRRF